MNLHLTPATPPREFFRVPMPSWRCLCACDWAMVALKVLLPYAAMGLVFALA